MPLPSLPPYFADRSAKHHQRAARGVESPTLMIERQEHTPGLLSVFTYVFEY
jgi:hypothetical protein